MIIEYKCYTPDCGFETNNKQRYEDHCSIEHPGRPCYPGLADLELYGWKAQGKDWEKPVDKSEDTQNYVDKLTERHR